MNVSTKKLLVCMVGSLALCSSGIALGDEDTREVDCAKGDGVGEALGKKNPDRPLTVVIRGTCAEAVNIRQNDVTLQGDGGAITGGVTIDGAQRAVIAGLALTNPVGEGITITNGASATLRDNDVNDSSGYGIFVNNGSFAAVINNRMLRNGIINPTSIDASGIGVSLGSAVRAARNEIRENANTGLEVFDNSSYKSEGDTIAQRSSAPGRSAVDTYRAGYVDLRGATITGQVLVNQQSQLQVRVLEGVGTITGNISVSQLAFLRLRSGVVRSASFLSCNSGSFALCQCDGLPSCPSFVP
jgi:parallel beta helix pectate lyase-like protein